MHEAVQQFTHRWFVFLTTRGRGDFKQSIGAIDDYKQTVNLKNRADRGADSRR